MQISQTLIKQLAAQGISYDIISHPYSEFSLNTARASHIAENKMVKSVILEDDDGYVMALLPANQRVKIGELNQLLNRKMGLATEETIQQLFYDCDPGAIIPVAKAEQIETVVDYNLDDCNDVYIEAGNHQDILHLNANGFRKLLKNARHANICMH